MIDLALVFFGGFLGSSHCLGMCGALALTLGVSRRGWRQNLAAQATYSCGRIATYASMGAVAGYAGWKLQGTTVAWTRLPAALTILAGLWIGWEGLKALGVGRAQAGKSVVGCLFGPTLSGLLRTPGPLGPFFAGMATGWMPCGLVYAFLSLAAARGHFAQGLATMVAFGLGTAPLMISAGVGGALLTLAARRRLMQLAGWCVLATGILTIARGAAFLFSAFGSQTGHCPYCG
jgi:uncharacterized protein